ncbi:HNH endonuclease signature motif containing protein [Flavobacterium sp.]|uniref:HNH endonuclease signature motif containing protein n=1 Tax=Flavobacterium sp. TaxID=239 RepID=UPI0024879BF0|nr:HNH endonuclease signature motif containing protein [Flavobacterium sp.]MDI1318087.1 HNH endonuclease signature motif containing protein [Flavobacterium sp.]
MREVNCTYKEEIYSVRDDGKVLRHSIAGRRTRPTDNQWTFGKLNVKNGYNEIATVRVHRIVATAFHGIPPTKEHVVDHIDTNKQNNRPENLRWVTRLENILLNPITTKRIIAACGSVEAFLANPSKFKAEFPEPNYSWMCSVSIEEAQISLQRLLSWAKSDSLRCEGTLGSWIFNRPILKNQQTEIVPEISDLIMAKNLNAVQRNWRIPSEFPCCPQEYAINPIKAYADNLKIGLLFCVNNVYSSLVSKIAISEDQQELYILSESKERENAIKPWALAKITYENEMFVHMNLGVFFTREGAEKQYCLAQGLEWSGGDSIDDYC